MGKKSIAKCLDDFFKDIEIRKHVDYGNRDSVKQYNAANDRIRKNLLYIDKNYPECTERIENLLTHSDPSVVTHVAVVLQDFTNCTTAQKRYAIDIIKNLLQQNVLDWPSAYFLSHIWLEKAEAKLDAESK